MKFRSVVGGSGEMASWVLGEEPRDSLAAVFNETQLCFYSTLALKSSMAS